MEFKDFTLLDLKQHFHLQNRSVRLFQGENIPPLAPSERLTDQLTEAEELPLKSEKARSEVIIAPILMELRRATNKFFIIYSGDMLIVDREKGLSENVTTFCRRIPDPIPSTYLPILTVVEAKRQDTEIGIDQCAAQLYGAYPFNQKSGLEIPRLYGCVTTADAWKFICLEGDTYLVDQNTYYLSEIEDVLGIFQHIMKYYHALLTT